MFSGNEKMHFVLSASGRRTGALFQEPSDVVFCCFAEIICPSPFSRQAFAQGFP